MEYKTGLIAGEGIWRWKIYDYKLNGDNLLFNELINKIIQYLSVEAKKQQFYVHTQKNYSENEQIIFSAEVYNKSYELIDDPEIFLEITDKKGHKLNYNFVKSNKKYRLNVGEFNSGIYKYTANVEYGNEKYSQKGVFSVSPVNIEYMKSSSDYHLLYQIDRQTGGKFYTFNEIENLKNDILTNTTIKSTVYKDNNYISLINLKWLFIVILLLLSTEWLLRKYFGSI
ncbi:MAG: hypothetical protein GXO79_02520 [Chlorobi bacterium]|nr:hypothetical protein [Chlorobiota bacterium]